MRDVLPDAHVAISVPPIEFLDRIASLAAEGTSLEPHKHYDFDVGLKMSILNLNYLQKSPHEGLFGQLVHSEDDGLRVCVEVRAEHWSGDGPPSYEMYVNALKELFTNLLSDYNRRFGTRYRLSIKAKSKCEPTLSPKAAKAFDSFVNTANKNGLHPNDWNRFYQFAKVCHMYKVQTTEENVFRLLVRARFSETDARELATLFGHLLDFQRVGLFSH